MSLLVLLADSEKHISFYLGMAFLSGAVEVGENTHGRSGRRGGFRCALWSERRLRARLCVYVCSALPASCMSCVL